MDHKPILVFLGSDERGLDVSLPLKSSKGSDQKLEQHTSGKPYWAIDVSSLLDLQNIDALTKFFNEHEDVVVEFSDMRAAMMNLKIEDSAVAGQGRALIDWHRRHQYCAGCGRPTVPVWGGWKRTCIEDGEAIAEKKTPACISAKGVHNFSYPRTDPVCIMAILRPTQDSILLGRQATWPKGFYSCLAGFLEPGESLEDAVRREVLEESGIKVDSVRYHSTQPWPYPGSLMIGAIGIASTEQIRTDLDNELEDARFFGRESILKVSGGTKSSFTRADLDSFEQGQVSKSETLSDDQVLSNLRMPPRTAIAFKLVESWAKRLPGWEGTGTESKEMFSKI